MERGEGAHGAGGCSKVLVETVESWKSVAAHGKERNLWQLGETLCDLFREIVLCAPTLEEVRVCALPPSITSCLQALYSMPVSTRFTC